MSDSKVQIIESCSFVYPKTECRESHDAVLPALMIDDSIYLALADGVGRSSHGKIAATTAINAVLEKIKQPQTPSMQEIYEYVLASLEKAAESSEFPEKIATTLVVCKITTTEICIANVGDSRAYTIRNGTFEKITNDHTEKSRLIERGVFTEKELDGHPSENILTNVMQPFKSFNIELHYEYIDSNAIILMSDGIYKTVKARLLINANSINLIKACFRLRDKVCKSLPKDDFSLTAVSFKKFECTE